MSLIIPANSLAGGGYAVDNSLRFNTASSDYLSKTFGSNGSLTTWTLSFWVKRSSLSVSQATFGSEVDGDNSDLMYFQSSDKFDWWEYSTGYNARKVTNQLFRDISAWYNIVCVWDTSNATSTDRQRIYVNGERITSFATNVEPALNEASRFNSTVAFEVGRSSTGSSGYFSGYMSDINFIDGQALTPTDFGEFDADSGVWKPIAYSGTYGTNGFFLEFQDSGALGTDSSGEGNNFTVNNLTSIDQTTDTPTNNFATLNPLLDVNAVGTYSEGNLVFTGTGSTNFGGCSIPVSNGKWFCEVKMTVNGSYPILGVIDAQSYKRRDGTYFVGSDINANNPSGFAVFSNGNIYHNNSSSYGALGTTYTTGNILGMALDMDSGTKTLGFYKNGTLETTINLDEPPSGAYMFATSIHSSASSGKTEWNFGNPPFTITTGNADANGYGNFEYAVPSGYYALNALKI
jgi:hypothetical protein